MAGTVVSIGRLQAYKWTQDYLVLGTGKIFAVILQSWTAHQPSLFTNHMTEMNKQAHAHQKYFGNSRVQFLQCGYERAVHVTFTLFFRCNDLFTSREGSFLEKVHA